MEQYNDEIQLKDILIKLSDYKAYLLKKKFAIIALSLTFCVLGILIAFSTDKKYIAKLTFVVEDPHSGGSLVEMSGIASQLGVDLGGATSSTFSQSNILELLKSRRVVVATLMQKVKIAGKEDLLIEHYLEINNIKEDWNKEEGFLPISYHDKLTYTHDSISGNIWRSIVSDKLVVEMQSDEANISSASYFSVNEEFAKQFIEVLIDEMKKMYVAHKTAPLQITVDFLQARADSVLNELNLAQEELAKEIDMNLAPQQNRRASAKLKELQLMRRVEMLDAMYFEIIKNLEFSRMTLQNKTPIINIIDRPILPLQVEGKSKTFLGLLGAFLGGFLSVLFFVFRKLFKDALAV